MTDINQPTLPLHEEAQNLAPKRIGGWLILPAINLIFVVLYLPIIFGKILFAGPMTPLGEVIAATVFLSFLYSVFCSVAFFQKRKITRKLMIAFYVGVLLLDIALLIFSTDTIAPDKPHWIASGIRLTL